MKKGFFVVSALWLAMCLLTVGRCTPQPGSPDSSNPVSREEFPAPEVSPLSMRGVWLSFLELDPLFAEATPASASAGLDEVMDTCRKAGLDTLFFHVRAHGDAYYPSTVYPAAEAVASAVEAANSDRKE